MLASLLEHLRGAGSAALEGVRRARGRAESCARAELAAALTTHLVVELSLLGNERYRRGTFDEAISCYEEAINHVEEDAKNAGQGFQEATSVAAAEIASAARDNLVRLRYNLGRALHRIDRWTEAREQATAVLVMDPNYVNAYALRAQAAMAALDWTSAQADWDRLMAISAVGGAGAAAPPIAEEVVSAWKRRREECQRHLNLGHYEVLELPKLASIEAVRRAYRDLARKWHPDKHQHRSRDYQERSTRRFNRIREAYEALCEESSKRAYDALLLLCEARPLSPGHRNVGAFEAGGGGGCPSTPSRVNGGSASVPPGSTGRARASRAEAAAAATCEDHLLEADLTETPWLASASGRIPAERPSRWATNGCGSFDRRLPCDFADDVAPAASPRGSLWQKVNLVNLIDPEVLGGEPVLAGAAGGQPDHRCSRRWAM